jgi:hypothetical protein
MISWRGGDSTKASSIQALVSTGAISRCRPGDHAPDGIPVIDSSRQAPLSVLRC